MTAQGRKGELKRRAKELAAFYQIEGDTKDERARYYSKADVADLLGVSIDTVERRIARGELRAYKLGKHRQSTVRIAPDDLQRFLDRSHGRGN